MGNPEIKKHIIEGLNFLKIIDKNAKKSLELDDAWGLILKITNWSKLAGENLILSGESPLKIENLLASNPGLLNDLIFATKMTDYKKTQVIYLNKLKKFVLLINNELAKKLDTPSKINTIYIDQDGIYIMKDGQEKRYNIKKERRKIFELLLNCEGVMSATKILDVVKYKNPHDYSALSTTIKNINLVANKKLCIGELIKHDNENGGYKLNRQRYNFD